MPKVTIKSLEEQLKTSREIREMESNTTFKLRSEIELLKADNLSLRKDKDWLQRVHSSLLQATSEMFRNR